MATASMHKAIQREQAAVKTTQGVCIEDATQEESAGINDNDVPELSLHEVMAQSTGGPLDTKTRIQALQTLFAHLIVREINYVNVPRELPDTWCEFLDVSSTVGPAGVPLTFFSAVPLVLNGRDCPYEGAPPLHESCVRHTFQARVYSSYNGITSSRAPHLPWSYHEPTEAFNKPLFFHSANEADFGHVVNTYPESEGIEKTDGACDDPAPDAEEWASGVHVVNDTDAFAPSTLFRSLGGLRMTPVPPRGTHIAGFLAPPHPEKGDLSTTSLGSARKRVHSQLMHWFILTPEVKAYIAAVMNWHPIPDWQLSLRTDAYAAWRSGGYNADTLELFSSPVRTFPASVRLIPNGITVLYAATFGSPLASMPVCKWLDRGIRTYWRRGILVADDDHPWDGPKFTLFPPTAPVALVT